MAEIHREGIHGTSRFPLGIYHNHSGPDGCLLYPHWHDDAEFFRLEEGQARLVADGEFHLLGPGDVACIPPGCIHGAWTCGSQPSRFSALVFDPSLVENPFLVQALAAFRGFVLEGACLVLGRQDGGAGTADGNTVSACLDRLLQAHEGPGEGRELRLISALYELCAVLPGSTSVGDGAGVRKPARNREIRILKTVLGHIQQEYHRSLGVEELARIALMGTNHFMRFFKKMTGTTAMDYLLQFRLEKASFLLTGTDLTIKAIANETGFANSSHFIRQFQARHGMSPGLFRNHGDNTGAPGNTPDTPS